MMQQMRSTVVPIWLIQFGALLSLIACTSCSHMAITRVEKDVVTVTRADSLSVSTATIARGASDNGIIFPSSLQKESRRTLVQRDSIVLRYFPGVLRVGLFEGTGLMGSQLDGLNVGRGVFGLHPSVDFLRYENKRNVQSDGVFQGAMYRIGVLEWPIFWFTDDAGWSWGITGAEIIQPDDNAANTLISAGLLTIRKRFYLSDRIPYTDAMIGISLGVIPDGMIHPHASLGIGSVGGINLRLNAGFPIGQDWANDKGTSFPYIGLGVSVLDFLNRPQEMDVEWTNHEHSAWNVSLFSIAYIGSDATNKFFDDDAYQQAGQEAPKQFITHGYMFHVGSADLALPLADYHITAGTSLLTLVALFGNQNSGFGSAGAIGVLPLRVGGAWEVFGTPILFQPFLEVSYLPSEIFNIGFRLTAPLNGLPSAYLIVGRVSGNTKSLVDASKSLIIRDPTAFAGIYAGIGLSLFDTIFGRKNLRYGRSHNNE